MNTHLNIVSDTSALLEYGTDIFHAVPANALLILPLEVVKELESKRTERGPVGYHARCWLRLIAEKDPRIDIRNSESEYLSDNSVDNVVVSLANDLDKSSTQGVEVVLLTTDTPMAIFAERRYNIRLFELDKESLLASAKRYVGQYSVVAEPDEDLQYHSVFENDYQVVSDGELRIVAEDTEENYNTLETIYKDSHALVNLVDPSGKIISSWIKKGRKLFTPPKKNRNCGLKFSSIEQKVASDYLQDDDVSIVSLSGRAGTGKTLVALSHGINAVHNGKYDNVYVLRSLYEMGVGQSIGLLPGTLEEKIAPWAGAIKDALEYLGEEEEYGQTVVVEPITYLRGRSLRNSFIIVEEAQNFSYSELLNIFSRVGYGSKVVLTFDDAQVDNPKVGKKDSADIWRVVNRLRGEEIFAHITLNKVERSEVAELASTILEEG